MDIDELNKRIIKLMVTKNHSKSTFAKALDVSLPLITHITSGRNKPGIDLIQKVLNVFEDISPDWLINGKGDMYRQEHKTLDFSDIQALINKTKEKLTTPVKSLETITAYHKILLDEVLHLQEMSVLASDTMEEIHKINTLLDRIKADINTKLEV